MTRKAGRPTGSGIKDGKYLDQIAVALIRDPDRKVNNIIMALDSEEDPENLRRRLHRKWGKQKTKRLEEARERHEERNRPTKRVIHRSGHLPAQSAIEGLSAALGQSAISANMIDHLKEGPALKSAIDRLSAVLGHSAVEASMIDRLNGGSAVESTMAGVRASINPFAELRTSGVFGLVSDTKEMKRIADPLYDLKKSGAWRGIFDD